MFEIAVSRERCTEALRLAAMKLPIKTPRRPFAEEFGKIQALRHAAGDLL